MKASHVAIEAMKGHLDAVYDVTVAYEGTLDAAGHRLPAPTMPGALPADLMTASTASACSPRGRPHEQG